MVSFQSTIITMIAEWLRGKGLPARRLGSSAIAVYGHFMVSISERVHEDDDYLFVEWHTGINGWTAAERDGLYHLVELGLADPTMMDRLEQLVREHAWVREHV